MGGKIIIQYNTKQIKATNKKNKQIIKKKWKMCDNAEDKLKRIFSQKKSKEVFFFYTKLFLWKMVQWN